MVILTTAFPAVMHVQIVGHLEPAYFKRGHWTKSPSILWEVIRNADLGPRPGSTESANGSAARHLQWVWEPQVYLGTNLLFLSLAGGGSTFRGGETYSLPHWQFGPGNSPRAFARALLCLECSSGSEHSCVFSGLSCRVSSSHRLSLSSLLRAAPLPWSLSTTLNCFIFTSLFTVI